MGVTDRELLRGVREDIGKQRYHIACNRVFEAAHKNELKKVSILKTGLERLWFLMACRLKINLSGRLASSTLFCILTHTSNAAFYSRI